MAYYPKFFADKDVFCWFNQLPIFSMTLTDLATDAGAFLSVMANIECNVGIICGSLPEIRPLFMRLFDRRKVNSQDPRAYQPSNPKSERSPRNATFCPNIPYHAEARKEKSTNPLDQVHKWENGKKSRQIVTETVYLENLSPEKLVAGHDHRTSGSGTDASHGSEENWISGGEMSHPKNIPSSAL
jgi:hypothetical protein